MQALLVGALQARDCHGPMVFCGEVTDMQTLLVFWTHSQLNLWTENLQTPKADCDMSYRYFIEGLCSVPTSITCECRTSTFSAPTDGILGLFLLSLWWIPLIGLLILSHSCFSGINPI